MHHNNNIVSTLHVITMSHVIQHTFFCLYNHQYQITLENTSNVQKYIAVDNFSLGFGNWNLEMILH